jgi:hypothetical protein
MKITRGFGNLTQLTNQINSRTIEILNTARDINLSTRNTERWYGKRSDQSGNEWAEENGLTPYRATTNPGDWGIDTGDEAKIWGTGDIFPIAGNFHYGLIRVLAVDNSEDAPCYIRFIWGTGTISEAVTAKQWSSIVIQNITTGSKSGGSPIEIMLPVLDLSSHKLWVQIKSGTTGHYVDFFVGVHALPEHLT